MRFEYDEFKNRANITKHEVSFEDAKSVFADKNRLIVRDISHSGTEERRFCYGKTTRGILTVRFTYRNNKIRIFGAGYWRQGRKRYENERSKNE